MDCLGDTLVCILMNYIESQCEPDVLKLYVSRLTPLFSVPCTPTPSPTKSLKDPLNPKESSKLQATYFSDLSLKELAFYPMYQTVPSNNASKLLSTISTAQRLTIPPNNTHSLNDNIYRSKYFSPVKTSYKGARCKLSDRNPK